MPYMPKRMPDSWLATDKTFQKNRKFKKKCMPKNYPRNHFEHLSSPEAAGAAATSFCSLQEPIDQHEPEIEQYVETKPRYNHAFFDTI